MYLYLESPLDSKEIKPGHLKGNQSWISIERTDVEAETLVLWRSDVKNWIIGKTPDAGKDWRQEKRTTEDEMVAWHQWLNGHEFEQILGNREGQRSLEYCNPLSHRAGHDLGVVTQSCPTLCYPMYRSLPGSSIHGIFQARVLEWVAISFSGHDLMPE